MVKYINKEIGDHVDAIVKRGFQRVIGTSGTILSLGALAAGQGGMDISDLASRHPEKIHRLVIHPLEGIADAEADALAHQIGIPATALAPARAFIQNLFRAFDANDALLVEVGGQLIPASCQVSIKIVCQRSAKKQTNAENVAWKAQPVFRKRGQQDNDE